jgi:hypothetical protein
MTTQPLLGSPFQVIPAVPCLTTQVFPPLTSKSFLTANRRRYRKKKNLPSSLEVVVCEWGSEQKSVGVPRLVITLRRRGGTQRAKGTRRLKMWLSGWGLA